MQYTVSYVFGWIELILNGGRLFVTNTNTVMGALDEQPRVEQCLVQTLLYTKMYNISLLCWRIRWVYQRKLIGVMSDRDVAIQKAWRQTLSTPKWKSPCPCGPRPALELSWTFVTASSGSASSE